MLATIKKNRLLDYKTVYTLTKESIYLGKLLPAIPFVILTLILLRNLVSHWKTTSKKTLAWKLFGVGVGLAFSLGIVIPPISEYFVTKSIYEKKKYSVVEGEVENFVPMPYAGHANESFSVNGIEFDYSDYDESYFGFNNTSSHGGPIKRNGQKVRLGYITKDYGRNIILRIETKK